MRTNSPDILTADNLVNPVKLGLKDKQFFTNNGFIKLKGLLTPDAIAQLRQLTNESNEPKKLPNTYPSKFSRVAYDIQSSTTLDIYSSRNFEFILKYLTDRDLAFSQGIKFEIKPGKKGFNWHFGCISFSYIMPEDLGYTLWIPLDPINTLDQHGGMAYVPLETCSTLGQFQLIYQISQQSDLGDFCKTEDFKESNIFFASKAENYLLERKKIEDDFEVGDAFLFDKFVWHRSCALREGKLPSRMAYVMRFVDRKARFSKIFLDGIYTMLGAIDDGYMTTFGYTLAHLKEGEVIGDNL